MRRSVVVLTCVAALAIAFTLQAVEKQDQIVEVPLTWHKAALMDGEQLYLELCAVCHGVDGTGGGPAAEALAKPVPDLTLIARHNDNTFPWEAVENSIRGEAEIPAHGSMDMPIWGRAFTDARPDYKLARRLGIADQRIYNLTSYLKSIQK